MLKTNPFASRNSKIRAVILKCNNQAAHGYILKNDKINNSRKHQKIHPFVTLQIRKLIRHNGTPFS